MLEGSFGRDESQKQKQKEKRKKTCQIWSPSVWPWRPQRSLDWDKELVRRVAPGRRASHLGSTDCNSARKSAGVCLMSLPLSLSVQIPDRKVGAALSPAFSGVPWLAIGFLVGFGTTAAGWCQQKGKTAAVEPEKPEMWSGSAGLTLEGACRAMESCVGSLHNRNLLKVKERDPCGDPAWLHTLVGMDLKGFWVQLFWEWWSTVQKRPSQQWPGLSLEMGKIHVLLSQLDENSQAFLEWIRGWKRS